MASGWRLIDPKSGRSVVANMKIADAFWTRFVGWQFRAQPDEGHGLLLMPCSSIHTCWMRFTLDVVGLAPGGQITAVIRNLRPWRAARFPRGTSAVLELAAGGADGLEAGGYLTVDASSRRPMPASLRRLFIRSIG